ncbi:hypothetical protein [Actinocrispum sp. NPDC049592]|uniref:hypothetical protein n=1 Tax=Actinocrispum sp. NPDC049592 TaxID=3154835 RepID=UPI00344307B3
MNAPLERSGTLILRVWVDGDALRVRVLRSIGARQAPAIAVTTTEEVHLAVQAWFDELLRRDS